MADDKLKTGPESPVLDHPGGGPAGDAQAVTKPPVPEEVEGPAAGTGPAPQPEQSVIPGMGKDAPAQPAPQVEAEKTGKSLNQDEALDPSAFLQALLPLRKKRMDASNRCTTLVHIANGYLYGGQPQQALAVLEDVQPPEKALEMRGLVAGNKATCFLAAGEMDRAQTAMDELRRIAADRSCKKEFVQKARHTLGYLQLCMDIARGRHADVGALQKDFESSRAPLHRLDVQYRIALALRHRGDRTGMEKSREYLLENSGGTCYGELARAL